jgi:YHS domain-containing protein
MFGKTKVSLIAAAVAVLMTVIAPASQAEERVGDPFTLDVCPVSGAKLDSKGDPVVMIQDGREVKFCCAGCKPRFEADPASFLAKIDELVIAQQKDFYPIQTCIVGGGKLGSMGDPIDLVVNNRHVRLCCDGCKAKLTADPVAFIAKLDKAVIAAQTKTYNLTQCPISGEALNAKALNIVVGNRLVKLCCAGCEDKVKDDVSKIFAMLDTGKVTAEGSDEK